MSRRSSCSVVKCTFPGIMYQVGWLALFSKRAVDREYSFHLFTEKESAKDFDDIVLRYEQDGKIIHRFIQTKHKKGRNKKISIGNLLTLGKGGAFGLIKYLIAYLKIKSNGEFEGEIGDFVIVTNADLDSTDSILHPVRKLRMMSSGKNEGKEVSVIRVDTQDEFLDVGNGTKYKFDSSIISYLQENKDFIKHEIGREVSDEEIEDFLNKLVFAVNLPSGTELCEIIKSEFCKEFSNIDAKHFYSRYQEEVLKLMEEEGERLLSYEEAKALSEKIREEILGAVWFDVRGPVRLFTGRKKELGMLHKSIQRNPKGTIISYITSISGPGGMGKSQLARKYACKHRKDYDGNVIWINAENFKTMKDSFLRLAINRLGISPKDKHGGDKTIEAIVEEIYTFFAKRRSLFIFDNVQEYKKISKFLPFFLSPDLNKPYILITSHDRELEKGIDVIKLGELEQGDAVEFVKKGFNIPKKDRSQDRGIKNLVRRLQRFPLAIQQAISYIEDQRITEKFEISDYLKEYEKKAKKLLKSEIFQGINNDYTKTTFTAFEVTMDKIRGDKQYGPLASEILDVLAYFAPDKIAREIFLNSASDYKKKQLKLAIRLLVRYSMVDGEQNQSVLNIHRLVQKVTRLKLREKGKREKVLRKALGLMNSGNVAQNSASHATSIWRYVSKHDKLIDDFYFDSTYGEYSSTPLHLLTENGNYKAIKAILTHMEEKYSDKFRGVINAKCEYSVTPLHLAAGSGWLNIVEYLIDKGANVDTRDYYYQTPLYWAVRYGKLDIVKYFIGKGANLDTEDWSCWPPLYWAVESENFDIAEYIMKEKGIDVGTRDSNGKTMLHEIVRFAKLDAIKYLIGKGIDINIKDGYGDTSLHWAAIRGKVDVVRYLVEQGADVNAKGNNDLTPLHWAVWHPNLKTVRYLVESGSDINAKSKDGWTSLHVIVKGNRLFLGDGFNEMLKVTEYLVQEGANINVKNKDGDTPLHFVAIKGKVDIAKILLKHNADVNAENNEGRTALYYAVKYNHQELVELLLAHGAAFY